MNQQTMNPMAPALQPGDKLGSFEVQNQLATGGMGIVWVGYDRLLARKVAIKQIAAAADVDEVFRERFRTESEVYKRVSGSHPNIVGVIDCIDDARGLFIVMEFAEGASMDRVMAENDCAWGTMKTIAIMRDVAQALQAIHAAGVVHRDLKPGNIMLAQSGPARVCDFGLATLVADPEALGMGTAQYMAPELFGEGQVDGRADIYALGMLAYQLLAGPVIYEKTFRAILRDQRHQAMRWMKWHTNPRITAPSLAEQNPQVPEVLSELVSRMMAKDPSQRIPNADVLLQTIQRHFAQGVPSPSPTVASASPAAAAPFASTPSIASASSSAPSSPMAPVAAPTPQAIELKGPATAALPTKKRWPIYVAAASLLITVSVAGVMIYQSQQKAATEQAAWDLVRKQFEESHQLYFSNKFSEAKSRFDEIADHPRAGKSAKAYALASGAMMAFEEGRQLLDIKKYDQAGGVYRQAETDLDQAESLALSAGLDNLIADIADRKRQLTRSKSFVTQASEIDQLIARGEVPQAKAMHLRLGQLVPPAERLPEEDRRLQEFASRLTTKAEQQDIDTIATKVAQQVADGQLQTARLELQKGLEDHPDAPALMTLRKQIEEKLELISLAAAASDAQGLDSKLKALQALQGKDPTPVRAEEIKTLTGQIDYQQAVRLYKGGDLPGAVALLNRAKANWNSPEVDRALATARLDLTVKDLEDRADAKAGSGDWAGAIELYRSALAEKPKDSIPPKLNNAMLRHRVQNADKLVAESRRSGEDLAPRIATLKQAATEVDAALGVDPTDKDALILQRRTGQQIRFYEFLMEAQTLHAQKKYSAAKTPIRKALDLGTEAGLPVENAENLKRRNDFEHNIQQIETLAASRQWVPAWGLLGVAEGNDPKISGKPDERIDILKRQIEPNVPKNLK